MVMLKPRRANSRGPAIRERVLRLHTGQMRVLCSEARFILFLAGTRAGKTFTGPPWLLQEIHKRGQGDYMIAAPTFPLLDVGARSEFCQLFERDFQLGTYVGSPQFKFTFRPEMERYFFGEDRYDPSKQTRVLFRHAADPEGLEAATLKAAWLDEAGQKRFRYGSWLAILRRLSIDEGRVLITTTPYSLGWLKDEVYDRCVNRPGQPKDPAYELVRCESRENPLFPMAEWERAKATLPRWMFDMMYRGVFTRPAGLIYDCFDRDAHTVAAFPIPPTWRRYRGMDFGGVNTAAVYIAEEPSTGILHFYREYRAGGKTAKGHAEAMQVGEPGLPFKCFGGSKSEDQWRNEFRQCGFPIEPPDVWEVEVGIQRLYGLIKLGMVRVHRPPTPGSPEGCARLLDMLGSYSRPVDEAGNVLEGIEDKESYHELDAARYIGSWIARSRELRDATISVQRRDERERRTERDVFLT